MTQSVVLIIREPGLRNELASALRGGGYDVVSQHHAEGLNALLKREGVCALVVSDALADADSGFVLRKARTLRPELFRCLVGATEDARVRAFLPEDDPESGVAHESKNAVALGDWLVRRLAEFQPEPVDPAAGDAAENGTDGLEPGVKICASSPRMQRILAMLDVVAPTDSTVLLQGESGTGKDLFARLLHHKSRRAEQPLVEVHCGAIPPNLVESELFGHVKGAFTGANESKPGLCLSADGGTLFLDEIGELPLDMQVKLLRVLQSGWLRPVGATDAVKVDIRVLAATHRDLRQEVLAGRFRLDLYYRLNVISIPIPPLRDRTQDIPDLVDNIIAGLAAKGIAPASLSEQTMTMLSSHAWPGNVRELENILERLLLLYPSGEVSHDELQSMLVETRLHPTSEAQVLHEGPVTGSETQAYAEGLTLREVEDLHIRRVLQKYEGNKTRAAQALGINVKTLYNKMKSAGIRKEDFLPERA